jgi:hypothetical protein
LFNASRLFLDAVVEVRQSLLQVAGVSKEIADGENMEMPWMFLWGHHSYGSFHQWGYPNSWIVYHGKSICKWMIWG